MFYQNIIAYSLKQPAPWSGVEWSGVEGDCLQRETANGKTHYSHITLRGYVADDCVIIRSSNTIHGIQLCTIQNTNTTFSM